MHTYIKNNLKIVLFDVPIQPRSLGILSVEFRRLYTLSNTNRSGGSRILEKRGRGFHLLLTKKFVSLFSPQNLPNFEHYIIIRTLLMLLTANPMETYKAGCSACIWNIHATSTTCCQDLGGGGTWLPLGGELTIFHYARTHV